jgi:D-alanine transaminase
MTRIVYVNGRYLPYANAKVHAEDRGFQFADAVYEVCEVRNGHLVDLTRHLERLARSLGELMIAPPMNHAALANVMRETTRRNRVTNGLVYLQVSRGAGPRDFLFPAEGTEATVVCLARTVRDPAGGHRAETGIAVITRPDPRWQRCDIKTVMLLPACLAKEEARREGAREVWFVDAAGRVTEGASSNAWIVDAKGVLVTRPVGHDILRGVTRMTLMDVARTCGYEVAERAFTVADARAAREAFITSATNVVMPVVSIDGVAIADARPGHLARQLRAHYHSVAEIAR